jgi:nitrite reductase/ring-hydroxylating ferredoxin subunit
MADDFNSRPYLANYWYPACASSQLPSDEPRPTRIFDRKIVLFRDGDGQPQAIEDQCCHQGAELSLGTVADGCVVCPYHGWRYNGSGRCVLVPSRTANSKDQRTFTIESFKCLEAHGYIFVWMGSAVPSPLLPIPLIPAVHYNQGSIDIKADWRRCIENNIDFTHPNFVHHTANPEFFDIFFNNFQDHSYDLTGTPTGLLVSCARGPLSVRVNFDLPCRITAQFTNHITKKDGLPHLTTVVLQCVPTGPNTTRMEWLSGPVGPFEGFIWRGDDEIPVIFLEDILMLESAQRNADAKGSAFITNLVAADESVAKARRIIQLESEGRWESYRDSRLNKTVAVKVRS